MIRFFLLLLVSISLQVDAMAQNENYFLLLNNISTSNQDSVLVNAIHNMPYDVMVANLDASGEWLNKALIISALQQDQKSIAKTYAMLAKVEYLRGNYEPSVSFNLSSIRLFELLGLKIETGAVLCELGYQMKLEQKFQVAQKDRDIARLQSQTASRRSIIIVIISALVLVVLGGVLYNINLRQRQAMERNRAVLSERKAGISAVFDATEEERRRIARELHDGLGQQLSGLRLGLGGVQNGLSDAVSASAHKLQQLNSVLDDACKEVRSISHQMMPKALIERGLLSALDELHQAIEDVMFERNYISEQAGRILLQPDQKPALPVELTEREIGIVRLIAEGFSNKEIGEKLFISHRTVDTHRPNLVTKIGVHNVAGIIRFAILNRLTA